MLFRGRLDDISFHRNGDDNGRKHIRRQLDSLAAQTLIPAELVVTDDGSDDDTISVVDAFAKNAPFAVKVFRNEVRLGYRKNFMRAASLCQSELIAFCDQDDYWYPNKIEVSVRPFTDSTCSWPTTTLTSTGDGERIGTLAEPRRGSRFCRRCRQGRGCTRWGSLSFFDGRFCSGPTCGHNHWIKTVAASRWRTINGSFSWPLFLAPLSTLTNRSRLTSNMEAIHTAGGSQVFANLWKSIYAIIPSGSPTLPRRRKGARTFSDCGRTLKASGWSGR